MSGRRMSGGCPGGPAGQARRARYLLADVFTDRAFGGNPLAVFPEASEIDPDLYPLLARELNLSETVFVLPPADPKCDVRLRIFTPARELPFAGHPTIGTAAVLATLWGSGPARDGGPVGPGDRGKGAFVSRLAAGKGRIRLEEGIGPIDLELERRGELWWGALTLEGAPTEGPAPPFSEEIATVLGLPLESLLPLGGDLATPVALSYGVPFTLVRLRDPGALAGIRFDRTAWERSFAGGWAPNLYVVVRSEEGRTIRARMFAPALGVPEDPATGSAAAVLGGYLAMRDPSPEAEGSFDIVQGVEMGRPSRIDLRYRRKGGMVQEIQVGGSTVVIGEGSVDLEVLRAGVEQGRGGEES